MADDCAVVWRSTELFFYLDIDSAMLLHKEKQISVNGDNVEPYKENVSVSSGQTR